MPGARPGGRSRARNDVLEERPVEPRVVRGDEVCSGDELIRGRDVDGLAGDVRIGESGDPGDFGRGRPVGVLAPGARLVVVDVRYPALEGVREGEHRELDDGVVRRVEAGGLAVDVEAAPAAAGTGQGMGMSSVGLG